MTLLMMYMVCFSVILESCNFFIFVNASNMMHFWTYLGDLLDMNHA